MRSCKRGPSPSDSPRKRTKKSAPDPVITAEDDEDDLASILAQIKAQEESEALARRLQEEWNVAGPSSSGLPSGYIGASQPHTTQPDFIEVSDGDDDPEDDDAMARRLAKEWEAGAFDSVIECVQPPSSRGPVNTPIETGKAKLYSSSGIPPISKLEQCRDLFTGQKTCTCGTKLPSPRGHVRAFPHFVVLLAG